MALRATHRIARWRPIRTRSQVARCRNIGEGSAGVRVPRLSLDRALRVAERFHGSSIARTPPAPEPISRESDAQRERLEALWKTPDTWTAWLSTVDHKALGKRYIYTAFFFFFLGGIE